MTAAVRNYQARMHRALDYIDRHLEDELDLETVSRAAAFSKFHFHRQFAATFDMSVHRYVQLARMRKASHQLADGQGQSVTDIAMDAGYEAPDAFARAFRQRLGQSPSAFRAAPDWGQWLSAFGPLDNARNKFMETTHSAEDVTIRDVPTTPVAIMEHRGDRATIPQIAQRFHAWRKANHVTPLSASSFMVFRSEREPEETGSYAMDLCVEIEQPVSPDDPEVKAGTIPGGRCAVMRVDGTSNNHLAAGLYLYRDWLPASGEEARDFPLYVQRRLVSSGDAPGHEVFAELFLPLR